jgi:hypothetical protein
MALKAKILKLRSQLPRRNSTFFDLSHSFAQVNLRRQYAVFPAQLLWHHVTMGQTPRWRGRFLPFSRFQRLDDIALINKTALSKA